MELGLRGKRGIVVGGSRGIGRAIAFELAREGVELVIAARNVDTLNKTAEEIASWYSFPINNLSDH
jgi:NAD(P)-dependent dehydrogenase (short-subunit alcohol dehydrogenase family)